MAEEEQMDADDVRMRTRGHRRSGDDEEEEDTLHMHTCFWREITFLAAEALLP